MIDNRGPFITLVLVALVIWLIITGRVEAGLSVLFGPKDKKVSGETKNPPNPPTR